MPKRSASTAGLAAPPALEVLRLLADDTRWRLVNVLRQSDRLVGELVAELELPQNVVSYHLGLLRAAGMVQVHRNDADARATYYGLDLVALREQLHTVNTTLQLPQQPSTHDRFGQTVLFLCTANSARSQIAEGWLRHLSSGRVKVRSAGTHPQPVHPLAIEVMAEAGVDIGYQVAKSVDLLAQMQPDLVVTVCDLAREEQRAVVTARTMHWSIPDPAQALGSASDKRQAFRQVRDNIRTRVEGLLPLLPHHL